MLTRPSRHRSRALWVVATGLLLLTTACSSPTEVTYVADHQDGLDVEVTYLDADGEEVTETVATPWTLPGERSGNYEMRLTVSNVAAEGAVRCEIGGVALRPIDGSGGGQAVCEATVSVQGSGTSIDSRTFGVPLLVDVDGALVTDIPPAERLPFADDAQSTESTTHVAVFGGDALVVIDVATDEVQEIDVGALEHADIDLDTDGNAWVASCALDRVSVIAAGQEPETVLDRPGSCPLRLEVLSDIVAVQLDDAEELVLLDRLTREEIGAVPLPAGLDLRLAEIGGRVLTSVRGQQDVFPLDVATATLEQPFELPYDIAGALPLSDGRTLVATSEGLSVFEGADEAYVLEGAGRAVVATDGQTFFLQEGDLIRRYDAATGEQVGELTPLSGALAGATADNLLLVHETDDDNLVLRRMPISAFG